MTDPYSLDYRGPLNLVWMHVGVEVPCDLHPEFLIRAEGCAYCHRIRSHRNTQLTVRAIERERKALAAATSAATAGGKGDA